MHSENQIQGRSKIVSTIFDHYQSSLTQNSIMKSMPAQLRFEYAHHTNCKIFLGIGLVCGKSLVRSVTGLHEDRNSRQ